MRVLITGVCGFVGSEIAADMSRRGGYDIVGLDNFSRKGSWRNHALLTKLGVQIRHGDVRMRSDLDAIGSVDVVIDASANASVLAGVSSNASSRQLFENNLQGTLNMLELCSQQGSAFILLSTSRVYSIAPLARLEVSVSDAAFTPKSQGDALSRRGVREDFSTTAPISLYGASKLASEQIALEYGHAFGFPVWVNRCGVMAGAGQFGKADQGIFAFWLHS